MDVKLTAGPTGLEPTQTSFFQALGIATKINKGSIEIISDVKLCTQGEKVGPSEAVLLTKMGIKPFAYGVCLFSCPCSSLPLLFLVLKTHSMQYSQGTVK